jgi:hypothetical protein
MKTNNSIIIHLENKEQENAVLAFVKALKMKFEISKDEDDYDAEFVKKIEKSKKEIAEGRGISMSVEDIKKLWK